MTLGAHPLLRVGREAGLAGAIVLGRRVDDALAGLSQEVIELQPLADVLLRDLVSEAHVRSHKLRHRLLTLYLGALGGLIDAYAVNLRGAAKDDTGCGEGSKKCGHVVCLWLNGLLYI